jgi:nitroreductase
MTAIVDQATQSAPDRRSGVLQAIRARRSIGRVRPERPPKELIEQVLEAAVWAPNHRLTEPWRFFVLAGEAREALGELFAALQGTKLPLDAPDRQAQIDKARAKPLRAPVVIAVAVEPAMGPKVVEIEEVLAGGAAVQNMLLAAHGLGLAAMWRTGDPAYDPAVKAFFGLPATAHIIGFVYVGYPAGAAPRMKRAPAAERVEWRGWREDTPG